MTRSRSADRGPLISRRQFELATLAACCAAPLARGQQPSQPPRQVPWLSEIQLAPRVLPADAPKLGPVLISSDKKQIETAADWQQRRGEIREDWLGFIGTWSARRGPVEYEIIESERVGSVMRRLIRYESERNELVEAYLLMPKRTSQPGPGVVVLHSSVDYTIKQGAGLDGPPEAAWGLKLAERGMVAICPRCFLWGGTEQPSPTQFATRAAQHLARHPHTRGMGKMLFDARRAIDLLMTLPEVDGQRIGAAGHSLGGKEALYLAALDDRVRAAVSSESGIGTTFSNWEAPWYLGTKDFGHEHDELLALIAPRPFLIIGGQSADGDRTWPFVGSALDVYKLYGQPCRIGLFNHAQGHTIPPVAEARTYQWLQTYL